MSLSDLQDVIDATRDASARPGIMRSDDGKVRNATTLADALWTQNLLNETWGITVATIRDDGSPHAAVSFSVCLDGIIYVTARSGTLLLHNLRARREVAISCLGTAMDSLMAVGFVDVAGAWAGFDPSLRRLLSDARSVDSFMPADWPGYIFRFEPEKLWTTVGS